MGDIGGGEYLLRVVFALTIWVFLKCPPEIDTTPISGGFFMSDPGRYENLVRIVDRFTPGCGGDGFLFLHWRKRCHCIMGVGGWRGLTAN